MHVHLLMVIPEIHGFVQYGLIRDIFLIEWNSLPFNIIALLIYYRGIPYCVDLGIFLPYCITSIILIIASKTHNYYILFALHSSVRRSPLFHCSLRVDIKSLTQETRPACTRTSIPKDKGISFLI